MNIKKTFYRVATVTACTIFIYASPMEARADFGGPGLKSGDYTVTIDVETVNITSSQDGEEVLVQAYQGESYTILEDVGDGWLKVETAQGEGYLFAEGNGSIMEMAEAEASETEEELEPAPEEISEERRQELVNFALQFVGGKYREGGNNPKTGFDCSGFTHYVMQHGAGVAINRSSRAQATQGISISAEQMRPGDLIFYGKGGRINHVAMYIGNGQVVHASTYKTGVKISNWNYREIIQINNMMGD